MVRRIVFPAGFLLVFCAAAQTPDGAALFKKHCAVCHFKGNTTRAPLPEALAMLRPEAIADSLERGSMKVQAAVLSAAERNAIVHHLVTPSVTPVPPSAGNKCAAAAPAFTQLGGW